MAHADIGNDVSYERGEAEIYGWGKKKKKNLLCPFDVTKWFVCACMPYTVWSCYVNPF